VIPKTGTLLDAVKKPVAANKIAAPTQLATPVWTFILLDSDKLDKSVEKVGKGSLNSVIKLAVTKFVTLKVDRLRLKLQEKARIDYKALDLDAKDRDRIGEYGHYHLSVGENNGLIVLFYMQEIDSKTRQIRLYLSKVTDHDKYTSYAAQARLIAGMPTNYTQTGQFSTDKLSPEQFSESVENPARRVLFSWLKRSLS
jgi:hypothetical protein